MMIIIIFLTQPRVVNNRTDLMMMSKMKKMKKKKMKMMMITNLTNAT